MELLDVYDENGNLTGKTVVRGDKNAKFDAGEHIAVAIRVIENSKHQFLIQKTSKQKDGLYAFTGGHIDHGETPMSTIKREVFEEIGIDISNDNVEELGYVVYGIPLRFVFYLKKDININDVKLQKDEVDYVSYMSIDEINKLEEKGEMRDSHAIVFRKVMDLKRL